MLKRPQTKKKNKNKKPPSRKRGRLAAMIFLAIPLVLGVSAWFVKDDIWLHVVMPSQMKNYSRTFTKALGAASRNEVESVLGEAEEFLAQGTLTMNAFDEVVRRYDRYQSNDFTSAEAREVLDYLRRLVEQAKRAR